MWVASCLMWVGGLLILASIGFAGFHVLPKLLVVLLGVLGCCLLGAGFFPRVLAAGPPAGDDLVAPSKRRS
jgi:hypothetical protein